jgi:CheY-like chemotaxis protein
MRSVLVVDDEPAVCSAVSRLVRILCPAVTAGSVAEAVAVLDGERPLAVMSDMKLPDGLGFDVVRYAMDRHPGTHAVLFSGAFLPDGFDPTWNDRASRLTGWPLLPKPFGRDTVRNFLLHALAATDDERLAAFVAQVCLRADLPPGAMDLLRLVSEGHTDHGALCTQLRIRKNTLDARIRDLRARLGGAFTTLSDLRTKLLCGAFGHRDGLCLEMLVRGGWLS